MVDLTNISIISEANTMTYWFQFDEAYDMAGICKKALSVYTLNTQYC